MQRKLLYFINPISGTKNKKLITGLIEKKSSIKKIAFEILHTNKEGVYSFLPEKILSDNITDIIICGGDGTIKQITSHILNCAVNIGVIPVGSGNGLALGAGIGVNINKALDIIFNGKADYIDGFYINNSFGCMLTGVGFDAIVAYEFSKQKKRGLFPYIKLSLFHFFKTKAYPFAIEINENKLETKALFISIANSNQFGSRIKIAPKATLSDGLLDVVVVNNKNKLFTAISILKQISFGKIQTQEEVMKRNTNISYFHAERLVIHNPALAPLHIDGEPAVTSSLIEIKIIKKAFKLLQPL